MFLANILAGVPETFRDWLTALAEECSTGEYVHIAWLLVEIGISADGCDCLNAGGDLYCESEEAEWLHTHHPQYDLLAWRIIDQFPGLRPKLRRAVRDEFHRRPGGRKAFVTRTYGEHLLDNFLVAEPKLG